MEIWDLHCHLSGVPGNPPEARLGKLLEYADRMGIARLCVFMGMEWSYDPSPEKMRQENDEVVGALRHFPDRAFGFVYLNAKHPRAKIICGHSGGDWEVGLRAIRPHKNIYADLGGGDPTSGFTEMAVRELGAERVLYGSDAGGRSFASQLAKVFGADIPQSSRHLILGGNLKRLLRPILDQKGIRL